jgi:SAM-dependent methyltransferase
MSTSSSASTGGESNGNGHQPYPSYQPSTMHPLDGVAELAAALQDTTVFPSIQVPTTPQPGIIEISNEVKRMLRLDRLICDELRGPLPREIDMRRVRKVLDVACGPGGWVHEMATRYPKIQLSGIDKNPYFISQARLITGGMRNVNFQVQDMLQMGQVPPFQPHSFDLIHMRFVAGEVHFQHFAGLIETLKRLIKPGGVIVWREAELALTSSPALDRLEAALLCALQHAGRSFAPGYSLTMGIGVWMRFWLRRAGFRNVRDLSIKVDVSYGTRSHSTFCEQILPLFQSSVRPLVLQTGILTERAYDDLLRDIGDEIVDKRFCGVVPIHTLAGQCDGRFS